MSLAQTRLDWFRERRRQRLIDMGRLEPDPDPFAVDAMRPAEIVETLTLLKRQRKAVLARDHFLDFVTFTMPHPEDPDDADRSIYEVKLHHQAVAANLEEVEAGRLKRLIVTMPPRAGKSELISRKFPPWVVGKNPRRNIIFATYNEEFAGDFGADVRVTLRSANYRAVFPDVALRKGEANMSKQRTFQGGYLIYAGRGGAITGRGADILILDDLIKDDIEAQSPTIRDSAWNWFNKVATTRLAGDHAAIVLVMTRWHEDDIVGRLTDRTNIHFNEEEADSWRIINIPAIAGDDDSLGRAPGELLWPERFSQAFLDSYRRRDARGFSALYQQTPSVDDGDLFRRDWFRYFKQNERPDNLRIYCASDHAVSEDQRRDYTVLLTVGVDPFDNIYVLDLWRARARTDVVVERMLMMAQQWKPLLWWAEKGHISKSIGPFLHKRMAETRTYFAVHEVTPSQDKTTRAQSIIGRCSMGKVLFPTHAPWLSDFESELLKFPMGTHDDQVDALAYIGLQLNLQSRAPLPKKADKAPAVGTLGWTRWAADQEKRQTSRRVAGW